MSRSDSSQPNPRHLLSAGKGKMQPSQCSETRVAYSGWNQNKRKAGLLVALLLTAASLLAHDSLRQFTSPSSASVADLPTPGVAVTSESAASPVGRLSQQSNGDPVVPLAVSAVSAVSATGPLRPPQGIASVQSNFTNVHEPVATSFGISRAAKTANSLARSGRSAPAGVLSITSSVTAPVPATQRSMLGNSSGVSSASASGSPVASAYSVVPFNATPQAVTLAAHPRLILDPATLATLRQRASANTAAWQLLKSTCDSYIGGSVGYPTDNAYPNLPNLGAGYQGESYLPALLAEGMCYQVLKTSNPTAAASYGAKAVDILMKMSTPYTTAGSNKGQDPCTDSGYGIRFFGVGYGLGYDWLYPLLTTAQRTQVYTTANAWITAWEQPNGCASFEYAHPQSNYFAGYFHAKAVIELATYDENPSAPAQWTDWLNNQFGVRVQPYYAKHLLGGGWPEGYGNYAALGILNMSLPAREVKTATGQDLIHATAPYTFPLDSADYAMHFTWPSRAYFDDRDTNHSSGNSVNPPGTVPVDLFEQVLGDLIYWNSPKVAVFNQYLTAVNSATNGFSPADAWLLFLGTDPSTPKAALSTLPLSYFAPGMNAVSARSDWTTAASWMSFRAGPYVNNPAQGEEYFDQGSLALVHGGKPMLVNAGGWMVHEPNGTADEANVYNDNFGTFNGTIYLSNRQLYNVFYVRNMSGSRVLDRYGQAAYTTEDNQVRTQVSAYEDGTNYVYVLATHLEDMYRPFSAGPGVSAWSREIVYLRPNRFVVYDRTTEGSSSYDQFLAWHFPAAPAVVSAPTGQSRLDVTYGGQYMGAMINVLPANTTTTTVPLYPSSNPTKVWQVQVRPPTAAVSQNWLTVFDLSSSASKIATARPVTVTQGAITGVQLLASDGNSVVVSSTGAAGIAMTGPIGYQVSPVAAYHVVTDLTPNTGYTATATASGSLQDISVSVGGTLMSSAKGVLSFYVTASGVVQPNPPAPPPPPYPTVPVSSLPVSGYPAPYTGP